MSSSSTPSVGPAGPRKDVFDKYARYYDLIYRDKDYGSEARFVHDCLAAQGIAAGNMLELGSGTGRHALEFARLGWNLKGYDLSPGMVENARLRLKDAASDLRSKLQFEVGDIRNLRDSRKFDAAISLFHVISYQTTNEDLSGALATAAAHLRPGGLFFFDFWFGPAVLSDPPQTRIKRLQDDQTQVTRLAEAQMDYGANTVTVNYDVWIQDRATQALARIQEKHLMRYLFLPELEFMLKLNGMSLLESGRWMEKKNVSRDSWYVWLIARKS